MLGDMIKKLREKYGFSQSELAKKLCISRSAVNAWEMGLSTPTTQYIVAMSKIFHVTTDYLLGLDERQSILIDKYNAEQLELLYNLMKYFDNEK